MERNSVALEKKESSNELFDKNYTIPPELSFTMKRNLKLPIGPKDDKENLPKITDICWGSSKYLTQLISIDDSGKLNQWDVVTNKILMTIEASKTWLITVDCEKTEGKKVSIGTLDAKLLIFDINTSIKKKQKSTNKNKPIHELVGHAGAVQCCKFLNGNYLISGSTDSSVCVWDLESPQRYLSRHNEHTADVMSMALFEGDSNIFLTGSSDLTANIWDIRCKKPVQVSYNNHESAINAVEFFPYEEPTTFATGSDDSTIKLHDLRMNKKEIATFQDEGYESVNSIAFSKTGRFLFAGTESTKIKVWDVLGAGQPLKTCFRNDIDVNCGGSVKVIKLSIDGYGMAFCGPKSDGIVTLC